MTRVTLWESDDNRLEAYKSYRLTEMMVKEFSELAKKTPDIMEIDDLTTVKKDNDLLLKVLVKCKSSRSIFYRKLFFELLKMQWQSE